MAISDDDPMAGGPSGYYNPEFGIMAIQQPEMFVQHLARNGVNPPADFDPDFDHLDAHKALGASLKDQSRVPQSDGQTSGLPQQGSFDERFSDAFRGAPGMSFEDPYKGSLMAPRPPVKSPNDIPPLVTLPKDWGVQPPPPPPAAPPPAPTTADVPLPRERPRFGKHLTPVDEERAAADSGVPWGGRPHVEPKATAASDAPSTAGGAAVPAGSSQERPGNLNVEDPTAKAPAAASTAEKKENKKSDKSDSWDSFGKALAGIQAMKPPPPVFPHPGNLPHPSNQISRSQYPTELLKELSQIGKPAQQLRLGALLKGR